MAYDSCQRPLTRTIHYDPSPEKHPLCKTFRLFEGGRDRRPCCASVPILLGWALHGRRPPAIKRRSRGCWLDRRRCFCANAAVSAFPKAVEHQADGASDPSLPAQHASWRRLGLYTSSAWVVPAALVLNKEDYANRPGAFL
jgi:hypothetical protein